MKILIGIDGSLHAERAVRLVSHMGWPEGTTFRIVEALAEPVSVFGALSEDAFAASVQEELDGPLARAAAILGRGEGLVERAALRGRPADALLEEARAYGADLIALGHRGHGRVVSLLLGSVAADVVERAPVPVLVARTDTLGPIVLGDDGSTAARLARGILERWPAFRPYPIRVVSAARVRQPLAVGITSAMRPMAYTAAASAAAEAMAVHVAIAEDAAAQLRGAGLAAEPCAVVGDPADAILGTAAQTGARLIVVGNSGPHGMRAILGGVARAVVLRAKCSVLVVPA